MSLADMAKKDPRIAGILLPSHIAWRLSRTRAVVETVDLAEKILSDGSLSADTAQRLREWIDRVKAGEPIDADHTLTMQEIVAKAL